MAVPRHTHPPGEFLWRLNDYEFGCGQPVDVHTMEQGTLSWRGTRPARPRDHGTLLDYDYANERVWRFNLFSREKTLDAMADLQDAWAAARLRGPGQHSTLSYGLPGGHRGVVFGRPGDFTPPELGENLNGVPVAVADFVLTDPVVYDADEQSLVLSLIEASDGGATWPADWPIEWSRSSQGRQGIVHVGGSVDVPFVVEVEGPVTGSASDVKLSGPGWYIDVAAPIPFDKTLVIDTRLATATVGGLSVAGTLSRRTRLDARLAAGNSEITFTCNDPTNTARATIRWRAGWWSL